MKLVPFSGRIYDKTNDAKRASDHFPVFADFEIKNEA
jgi:endonuclease/exonuclease/phosphatase (EEP) superfamily protein YafD